MIWMRRLHVVNWMYYGIQTVEVERSNLLTGVTGSGKSSLIDALQVVMLGETSRFFNRSATGAKSDRTLVTYLRGKYHESEFKRADKAFSSYLAIDFYDDLNREEFSYGAVFDISEDNTIEKDYFYIPGYFRKEWALKPLGRGNVARSRSEFKKELKEHRISIKLFTPGEYKSDLLVRLGIYDEHFFQVFRTAVAYVPLDKIEDFIVTNICHMEDNIDVPKMKAAIHEYQRMQRDMADFQERQRELEELKGVYSEFSTRFETYQSQEYIVQRAKADRLLEEQRTAEAEIRRLESEREGCSQESERLRALMQERQRRQTELTQQINSDPATTQRKEINAALETCNRNIKEREKLRDEQILRLEQQMTAWKRRLRETIESPANVEMNCEEMMELSRIFGRYGQYTKENFHCLNAAALGEANGRLEHLRNEALTLQTGWKALRNEARKRAGERRTQLEELEKGVKSYPKDLLALRAYLQKELSIRSGKSVQVVILADLISIIAPAWVNVTEGYLRRQKLYLLTEPNDYREAVRLFKQYSRENKCYQYRVVNTGSILSERMEVRDNSLAKIIATNHPAARKYVDYLLGRVERVEDISVVNGRRTAVTVDGMLYQAFATARMNSDDWKMRYIGQDSIAQQLEEVKRILREEEAQIEVLNQLITPLQAWVEGRTLSDEFLENTERAVKGTEELLALEKEAEALWMKIQSIDDSYVKGLEAEKEQINDELSAIWGASNATSRKIGELNNEYMQQFQLSREKEQAWEAENAHFSLIYPEGNVIAERTAMRYESELQQKGSAEKVQLDFEPALGWTKTRLDTLKQNFREKAEIFNHRHADAAVSTDLASSEWRRAYDEVKSVRLEEYTEQVAAARARAEEIFYNEFINQLKSNFDTVKREINLLNKALEEYTFGKTKYRFKWSPTENAEMRRYYDMINSTRLDGASIYALLEPGADLAEYEPLVKTLFQMISSEGTDLVSRQQAEANIEKYNHSKPIYASIW